MKITLVYAPAPRQVLMQTLEVPLGTTALGALQASGWLDNHPELGQPGVGWGVWGRKAQPDTVLAEGDRLVWVRPLRVDPKVARRERFGKQGARAAGLFAQRRAGAKAGY